MGYKNLTTLKNLSNIIDFKETTLNKLNGNCQKRDQTGQPLRNFIFQNIEFLGWVYNDLEGLFP